MAKMSVAQAAETWESTKREIDRLRTALEASAEVLKAHFRKNGKREYKGRIGYAVTARLQLDTEKVKAELGERLPEFQKRITSESLSLLR